VQHLLAVVGNIASGKSTLVKALATTLRAADAPERWFDNPFLEPAQRDPTRYALAAESWFLVEAAAAQVNLERISGGILERPLDEHLNVFVANRRQLGQLTREDASALLHLADGLRRTIRPADLLIFLHAPPDELHRRIEARGRPFEQTLTVESLAQLDDHYRAFIAATSVPIVDVNTSAVDIRTDSGFKEVLTRVRIALG
jgi:deoxyadenosine/deoxycytidine kinase